jgi:hypothetical protein
MTYGRALGGWAEYICTENTQHFPGRNAMVPTSTKPDF